MNAVTLVATLDDVGGQLHKGARDALARHVVRHAPRGEVRVAEALAAMALNRRRRASEMWEGAFADRAPPLEEAFAALPVQLASARADAAWNAVCRRIAARALAGGAPDPSRGGQFAVPLNAPPPADLDAPELTARVGPFAFFRNRPPMAWRPMPR
ncbi:MAG: hypothetical protein KIT16_10475 [Rhodospirillaceae bacterium]|nr:hypothetical protein [Rhodospirillaceae bacterium]